MYANAAIHFRDPFAARDSTINRQPHHHGQSRANWSSQTTNQGLNRALTPPPDMNSVSHALPHGNHQEHGQYYNNAHMSNQSTYRAPTAQYQPYGSSQSNDRPSHSRDGRTSPRQSRTVQKSNDSQSRTQQKSNSAIAPAFQIPKSVNDSGGSLSELAAEVSLVTS